MHCHEFAICFCIYAHLILDFMNFIFGERRIGTNDDINVVTTMCRKIKRTRTVLHWLNAVVFCNHLHRHVFTFRNLR
ncbi:hypothetical protein V12B01_13450 [Vibrio splendidus 12B01]|nr:hypothetical protein V12B01_13450 [Vibrio splendidus 12B01]